MRICCFMKFGPRAPAIYMRASCIRPFSGGLARRAVLLIPPRPPVPRRLPLYTSHPPLNHLQSTLVRLSASVDSKMLTKNLNPLPATLTKNRGGGPFFRPQSLSTRYSLSVISSEARNLSAVPSRHSFTLAEVVESLVTVLRTCTQTRHARVAATPISSYASARFPSHMGVGVARPPSFQVLLQPLPCPGFCLRGSAAWRRWRSGLALHGAKRRRADALRIRSAGAGRMRRVNGALRHAAVLPGCGMKCIL
jgi:hypothetical protein